MTHLSGDKNPANSSLSLKARSLLEEEITSINFAISDNFRQGNFDNLLSLIDRQEALHRALFGEDSPITIYSKMNRAKVLAHLGIATESLSQAQEVLNDLDSHHASPMLKARANEDLAEIISLSGGSDSAVRCKELFDVAESYYNNSGDLLEAIQSRFRLADFLFKLNDHDLAYQVLDQAVEIGGKFFSRNWAERERKLVLKANS